MHTGSYQGEIGQLGEQDLTAASLTAPGKFVITSIVIHREDGGERARGEYWTITVGEWIRLKDGGWRSLWKLS